MKSFKIYITEEDAPPQAAQPQQPSAAPVVQNTDVLQNPSYMFDDYDKAFDKARSDIGAHTEPDSRMYILKYKYYEKNGTKPYLVIQNKQLLSQAPDYQQKGYTIIGWMSVKDGKVVRTKDGRYIKGK